MKIMTHAQIRETALRALINMDRADRKLELSEHESIPSVAKMLKEDSAVLYRSAVLTLKDAASQLD
jgi:vesicle coat complex subunit